MPRTHPPTLLTLTARALRESPVVQGGRLLAAVSGGPDSMALLHVLARLRERFHFELAAHGVDHGLREAASAELDVAEDFARQLGVAFSRTALSVSPGGNLQARARAARYEALRAAAASTGCATIATAHHRDDRAETVLLRLLRGAGPAGLAVLPPLGKDDGLLRPFLRAPRSAIFAHVARHGIPSSDDPSNHDPRFLRSRVRHELLPLLRELSPGIDEHLCALADQLFTQTVALAPLPPSSPYGRASRQAIARLRESPSLTARVALKHGQVARWDALRGEVVVTAEPGAASRPAKPAQPAQPTPPKHRTAPSPRPPPGPGREPGTDK